MVRRSKKKRHPPRRSPLCSETGKRRYDDYGEAAGVALRRSRHAGSLRIYECPSCGSWHLTKRRSWDGATPKS
ncbi:hypothetical protein DCC27_008220 [Auritidibacter sp. NML130574]|nr:hypothetical protein DCC27_008220 [Auritidibacter sp. NML130574]PXA82332.1 hypothetical protein DCC26_00790 [Auritidibacter sp. NML120779]